MTNDNHVMFHKLLYKTGFSDKSYRWLAKDNYKYFRKLGFGIERAINETDHALYQWYNSNGRYTYRSIYNG